jgi:hypothetical protein
MGSNLITLDEVKEKLLEIANHATSDDEAAHSAEDALWFSVLEAIAAGSGDAKELAQEALKSRDIEFHRWKE